MAGAGAPLRPRARDSRRRCCAARSPCAGRPDGTFLALDLAAYALDSEELQAALPGDLAGLVLEVDEEVLLAAGEGLDAGLARLRHRGARLTVDRAGAGYGALRMLMRVRPDLVKLDRALVESLAEDGAAQTLVESLVRLSRSFHGEVCADGVEERGGPPRARTPRRALRPGPRRRPGGRGVDAARLPRRGHRPAQQGGGRLPAPACVYRAAGGQRRGLLLDRVDQRVERARRTTPRPRRRADARRCRRSRRRPPSPLR